MKLKPEQLAEIRERHTGCGSPCDSVVLLGHITALEDERKELQEFAIWMTGCGYDFCQHGYFCKQRDKLLKQEQE